MVPGTLITVVAYLRRKLATLSGEFLEASGGRARVLLKRNSSQQLSIITKLEGCGISLMDHIFSRTDVSSFIFDANRSIPLPSQTDMKRLWAIAPL